MLSNANIILTRTPEQSMGLIQKIRALQGNPIIFPTLKIESLHNEEQITEIFSRISEFDYIIFTSQNAVNEIQRQLSLLRNTKVIAVGPSTANLLKSYGLVPICPKKQFNSESLLALTELQHIEGKSVLIVKGLGGRDYLENHLQSRHARVTLLPVYKRQLPMISREQLKSIMSLINTIVVSTSSESLRNLMSIVRQYQAQDWLSGTPILVISSRMKEFAIANGLRDKQLWLAGNATDEAILECLIKWYSWQLI